MGIQFSKMRHTDDGYIIDIQNAFLDTMLCVRGYYIRFDKDQWTVIERRKNIELRRFCGTENACKEWARQHIPSVEEVYFGPIICTDNDGVFVNAWKDGHIVDYKLRRKRGIWHVFKDDTEVYIGSLGSCKRWVKFHSSE